MSVATIPVPHAGFQSYTLPTSLQNDASLYGSDVPLAKNANTSEDSLLDRTTAAMASETQLNSTSWNSLNIYSYAIYGSLSILCVDSMLYPLELVRTRMQGDRVTSTSRISQVLLRLLKTEGPRRLFRGICPAILGSFPGQASYYATYEFTNYYYSKMLKETTANMALGGVSGTESTLNDILIPAMAGFSAELASACFYVPSDTISQRLQMQPKFNFHHRAYQYDGTIDVVRKIYERHGLVGFYH